MPQRPDQYIFINISYKKSHFNTRHKSTNKRKRNISRKKSHFNTRHRSRRYKVESSDKKTWKRFWANHPKLKKRLERAKYAVRVAPGRRPSDIDTYNLKQIQAEVIRKYQSWSPWW